MHSTVHIHKGNIHCTCLPILVLPVRHRAARAGIWSCLVMASSVMMSVRVTVIPLCGGGASTVQEGQLENE